MLWFFSVYVFFLPYFDRNCDFCYKYSNISEILHTHRMNLILQQKGSHRHLNIINTSFKVVFSFVYYNYLNIKLYINVNIINFISIVCVCLASYYRKCSTKKYLFLWYLLVLLVVYHCEEALVHILCADKINAPTHMLHTFKNVLLY